MSYLEQEIWDMSVWKNKKKKEPGNLKSLVFLIMIAKNRGIMYLGGKLLA